MLQIESEAFQEKKHVTSFQTEKTPKLNTFYFGAY